MCAKVTFGVKNIFSAASRERCLSRIKKFPESLTAQGRLPAKTAAVLVPLCSVNDVPSLLYTVRATNLRNNGGQVAFPGGKTDENETAIQTALRETYEEIGIPEDRIQVWGQAPAVPGGQRRTLITPVIGAIENLTQCDLNINSKEVSEAFTVPIEILCDPKNQFYTQFSNGFILPVFLAENYRIWGITAYITHAFLNSALSNDVYRNEWMRKKIVLENV